MVFEITLYGLKENRFTYEYILFLTSNSSLMQRLHTYG